MVICGVKFRGWLNIPIQYVNIKLIYLQGFQIAPNSQKISFSQKNFQIAKVILIKPTLLKFGNKITNLATLIPNSQKIAFCKILFETAIGGLI